MKSFRTSLPVFGILGILLALAGCSAENGTNGGAASSTSELQATAAAADKTADARPHASPFHHGPDGLVFAALHENINLTTDQRTTIQALVSANRPSAPPAPDKTHIASVAAAIRSGTVQSTALAMPAPDAKVMSEHRAAAAKNLQTLHDTLTKEQRVALVDAVTAKGGAEHGDQAGKGPRGGDHEMHLLAGLDLTQAQKDTIKAKLDAEKPSAADREAMKVKFDAMKQAMNDKLQTFKNDGFDANAFVTPPANVANAAHPDDHMGKELSVIVSVLDSGQREKLAQKIEQGPMMKVEAQH